MHHHIKPCPLHILHSFNSALLRTFYPGHWDRHWGFNEKKDGPISCPPLAVPTRLQNLYMYFKWTQLLDFVRHTQNISKPQWKHWISILEEWDQFQCLKIYYYLSFLVFSQWTTCPHATLSLAVILISQLEGQLLKMSFSKLHVWLHFFLMSSSLGTWDKSCSVPPSTRQTTWPLLNSVTWTHPQPSAVTTSLSVEGENQINLYMETASIMVKEQRP